MKKLSCAIVLSLTLLAPLPVAAQQPDLVWHDVYVLDVLRLNRPKEKSDYAMQLCVRAVDETHGRVPGEYRTHWEKCMGDLGWKVFDTLGESLEWSEQNQPNPEGRDG